MVKTNHIACVLCVTFGLLVVHGPVYGQAPPDTREPAENSTKLIKPILKDQLAPFTGLLVPEARFVEMVEAELAVDDLKGKLKIQTNLTTNLESIYVKRMEEMAKPPKWYQTGEFQFWLGFTLGFVATVAATYGAVKIVEATK